MNVIPGGDLLQANAKKGTAKYLSALSHLLFGTEVGIDISGGR
jgi:hypothetical protein